MRCRFICRSDNQDITWLRGYHQTLLRSSVGFLLLPWSSALVQGLGEHKLLGAAPLFSSLICADQALDAIKILVTIQLIV